MFTFNRFRPLHYIVLLAIFSALLFVVKPSYASVLFQNTGTLAGWDDTSAQHIGSNTQVSSPVYQGPTAIRSRQIYQGSNIGRYHAEVVKNTVETNGEDRYFGQTIYFPSDWEFHNQNVTFQQFAPDNNAGPWIMMFIQGTKLRYAKVAGIGTGIWDIMDITTMRGQWIRLVTHLKMSTTGIFEVWINGTKKVSVTGDWSTSWAANSSIRWSSGIYCTAWVNEAPLGQSDLSIYHDQFRIATSYNEAEPASWSTANPTATFVPSSPSKTPTKAPTVSGVMAWAANVSYSVGQLVTYGGKTYKCIQAHTSQVGWEPPNVPALWQLV